MVFRPRCLPVGVGQGRAKDLGPAIRQYPLLLPTHFRMLLSAIPRIRRLCRLAAVVFHSFQRTCRRRRRSQRPFLEQRKGFLNVICARCPEEWPA